MNTEQIIKLQEWTAVLQEVAGAKLVIEKEQALRKEVAKLFFVEPAEGTNTEDLEGGWKLKLTHKIDRKVDEASLFAVKEELRKLNINPDALVRFKPELDTKAYKALKLVNEDAAKVFEQALLIKEASPALELVAPKV